MAQDLIVALIVAVCAVYVAWTLMPQAWRRSLQRRLPLRQTDTDGGCGHCGACASPPKTANPAVVTWRPRPPAA